ncbi:hypothetical protein, conserved [Eimeria necatrix]|uniref:AP2-coincident C-terminal domain-containing protein n=1 Tax=Eimeria necatrix TaxID=51315 RepID=U6MT03_9EIME|nr:hypothetical protein, conserved [Eimeria necatrix]CDJ67141.1 hypothetical protein, conserved [Eimeria necatrix]
MKDDTAQSPPPVTAAGLPAGFGALGEAFTASPAAAANGCLTLGVTAAAAGHAAASSTLWLVDSDGQNCLSGGPWSAQVNATAAQQQQPAELQQLEYLKQRRQQQLLLLQQQQAQQQHIHEQQLRQQLLLQQHQQPVNPQVLQHHLQLQQAQQQQQQLQQQQLQHIISQQLLQDQQSQREAEEQLARQLLQQQELLKQQGLLQQQKLLQQQGLLQHELIQRQELQQHQELQRQELQQRRQQELQEELLQHVAQEQVAAPVSPEQISSLQDQGKEQQQLLAMLQDDQREQEQQEEAHPAAAVSASSAPKQQESNPSSTGSPPSSGGLPASAASESAASDYLSSNKIEGEAGPSPPSLHSLPGAPAPEVDAAQELPSATAGTAAVSSASEAAADPEEGFSPALPSKVPRGVWFNRSTGCWLACVSGVGKRLHVFSSKRYGHERAFQMAVNCKEADKAQAAGGGGGTAEGASGGPGVPPQDVFTAPTPKGQTAAASPAAAGGSRRNRNAAARRQQQQQQQPHVRAFSPGGSSRGPDMYVTTMRQGEGDDDEAMDSATDTRTDEGSHAAGLIERSKRRRVLSWRGAEAAASGLYSSLGGPEEGGSQRGNGALCSSNSSSNTGSMRPATRTSSGGTYERHRTESLLDGVPKGVWFNSHTKSWTCTTAGPKRQLLVFSSNRFGFAEARRMAISARLASLKLEGLPVPHCPLLYEPPGGVGASRALAGPTGDGSQLPGATGLGGPLGVAAEGWGGYSPHEGGDDGYGGHLGGVAGARRRRRQRDGAPHFVNCRQRRGAEGDESGSDPWDTFRSGLPLVAEKDTASSSTTGAARGGGFPLRRLCASERRLLEVGSIALELLLKDLLRLCGEELAGAAACFTFPVFAAIRRAISRTQKASDPLQFQSLFKAFSICVRCQKLPSRLGPRQQAELLTKVLAAERVYKKEQEQQQQAQAASADATADASADSSAASAAGASTEASEHTTVVLNPAEQNDAVEARPTTPGVESSGAVAAQQATASDGGPADATTDSASAYAAATPDTAAVTDTATADAAVPVVAGLNEASAVDAASSAIDVATARAPDAAVAMAIDAATGVAASIQDETGDALRAAAVATDASTVMAVGTVVTESEGVAESGVYVVNSSPVVVSVDAAVADDIATAGESTVVAGTVAEGMFSSSYVSGAVYSPHRLEAGSVPPEAALDDGAAQPPKANNSEPELETAARRTETSDDRSSEYAADDGTSALSTAAFTLAAGGCAALAEPREALNCIAATEVPVAAPLAEAVSEFDAVQTKLPSDRVESSTLCSRQDSLVLEEGAQDSLPRGSSGAPTNVF